MVKLLGGTPAIVEASEQTGFKLVPDALERAITARTKWLFLNTPGNPSGAAYSDADLKALGAVLARHPQVLVLSDEIYEHILFDGREFTSFGKACPELRERSLIVNGVAKAYAMTGWRVGYAAGPAPLVKAMSTIQSQSVTSVCSISQAATVAALNGPQDEVARFRQAFERRRNLVVDGIRQVNGLTLSPPDGAFYAYVGCASLLGRKTPHGAVLTDDAAVASYLLNDGHVASVPGVAFGLSPYFRISTATSEENLSEAIRRIKAAVSELE
jgi:aspartate aminotransferase